MGNLDINKGTKVIMKKGHPCGSNEWKVIRYGADVKLECLNCGRVVLLERVKFIKNVKKVVDSND